MEVKDVLTRNLIKFLLGAGAILGLLAWGGLLTGCGLWESPTDATSYNSGCQQSANVNAENTSGNITINQECGETSENDDIWSGGCFSIPSCTQVPCSTCQSPIGDGSRECQRDTCEVTE